MFLITTTFTPMYKQNIQHSILYALLKSLTFNQSYLDNWVNNISPFVNVKLVCACYRNAAKRMLCMKGKQLTVFVFRVNKFWCVQGACIWYVVTRARKRTFSWRTNLNADERVCERGISLCIGGNIAKCMVWNEIK